jgi:regulator of sigma D
LNKLIDDYAASEEKTSAHYGKLKTGAKDEKEAIWQLNELEDERFCQQTMSNNLFYQQGFSDAIRMILITLIVG